MPRLLAHGTVSLSRTDFDEDWVKGSDAGTQGGFKWSSQHLVMEVVGDGCSRASAGGSRDAWSDVVAGPTLDGAA